MDTVLILNTGGTFNKIYNPVKGKLEVSQNGEAIKEVLKYQNNLKYRLKNIIHKDSLDMNDEDRQNIMKHIEETQHSRVIVIHGTDTMDITAKFLSKYIKDKMVILTGAMVPFSIQQTGAATNFALAVGFSLNSFQKGVFISMQGMVEPFDKVYKNRKAGLFQRIIR
jgi:L-asparaginase